MASTPLALVLGALALGATWWWVGKSMRRPTGAPLTRLEYFPLGLPIADSLGDLQVRVDASRFGDVTCRVELGSPEKLVITDAVSVARPPPDDSLSGDPEFDARVRLRGDKAQVCAALDAATRVRLLEFLSEGGGVEGSYFKIEFDASKLDGGAVRCRLESVAELAGSFCRREQEELQKRLESNALSDPTGGVRLRNLALLVELSERARLSGTLSRALSDEDAEVRLLAARSAHKVDLPAHLSRIPFRILTDSAQGGVAAESRGLAIRALGRFALERTRTLLLGLVHDPEAPVRCAAADVLAAHGWNPEAGSLTLAEPNGEDGALSLASEEAQLSLMNGPLPDSALKR